MTPTQREAALRLAEYQEKLAFAVQAGGDSSGFDLMDTAALLRELAAVPKSAIERFNETEGVDAMSPLERLRFFCSLSMTPQDWLDVEPFFDALAAEPQGEPVAWFYRSISGAQFVHFYKNTPRFLADQDAAEQWPDAHSFMPLYAHPPQQRKPLTDEQIKAMWWQCESKLRDADSRDEWWSQFARAIERAHGIKEAP